MPGFACIKLTVQTLGAVMSSLSDTPGAEGRFFHACLVYQHTGEDVYFVRGNYKKKTALFDFYDHLFTEAQLNEVFEWSSSDGIKCKYKPKPNGEWFVVYLKGSALIDALYDEENQLIMRRPRGDLQTFLKKSGGRYLSCFVQPYGSEEMISVRKYKGEFNREEADKVLGKEASEPAA